jgi:hypothetical protein
MNRREFLKGLIATGIVTICPIPILEPKTPAAIHYAANHHNISAMLWSRQLGKSFYSECLMAQFLKENPNARAVRVSKESTEVLSSAEEVLSRIRYGYGEDVYKFALDRINSTER